MGDVAILSRWGTSCGEQKVDKWNISFQSFINDSESVKRDGGASHNEEEHDPDEGGPEGGGTFSGEDEKQGEQCTLKRVDNGENGPRFCNDISNPYKQGLFWEGAHLGVHIDCDTGGENESEDGSFRPRLRRCRLPRLGQECAHRIGVGLEQEGGICEQHTVTCEWEDEGVDTPFYPEHRWPVSEPQYDEWENGIAPIIVQCGYGPRTAFHVLPRFWKRKQNSGISHPYDVKCHHEV